MNIILFEDQHVGRLEPMTLSRPAYALSCGGMRLVDLAHDLGGTVRGGVRPYLEAVQADYLDSAVAYHPTEMTLLLNARLVPDANYLPHLQSLLARGEPARIMDDESIVAAVVNSTLAPCKGRVEQQSILDLLASSPAQLLPEVGSRLKLLRHPHDVISAHTQVMQSNVEYRLQGGNYRELADGVFAAGGVTLPAQVVCDTTGGAIVLETDVAVGPFCYLKGPLYAAANTRISEHTSIQGNVALGHTTKVGGEISNSIIEPYSNKRHFGYLGDAYVGSWVNVGAGTTNSNLKNTYGTIRVDYGDSKVDTGMQLFGCVIGDYSKTAVNTGIFTGKLIGVCSNVYGLVTTNVPSFANYARIFGEVTELPPEVMEMTQRRVFARRGVEQRPCDIQLLRDMYRLESQKRKLANHPPSL